MVFGKEVLVEVIGKVFSSLLPVYLELVLFDASVYPVEAHVKSFGALPAHVAGEDAVGVCAVGLDWDGRLRVGGCGWPILMRAVRMGTAFWLLRKIPPVLASVADAITLRMV